MHISKINLVNFKRFRKLTIDLSNLQLSPKLVLVTGANGSGKSSLFDAFEWISIPGKDGIKNESTYYEDSYYIRFSEQASGTAGQLPVSVKIDFDNSQFSQRILNFVSSPKNMEEFFGLCRKDLFYGRSAVRQTPRIIKNSSKLTNPSADVDRPHFYTDIDERFENDVSLWKKSFVELINKALKRIFAGSDSTSLTLVSILPAKTGKFVEIKFKKGTSVFGHDLLSSGEKAIFGTLLNLLVRRRHFQDSIYFIDELDVHLNTSLQYAFLKEITENWIPENCQLWTASHSLGFIQYAKESENAAILNFEQLDFDSSQIIFPQPKEDMEIYEIAVPKDMLSAIFKDKLLTFCENEDAVIYNAVNLPNRLFVPAEDKNDVYFSVKNNPKFFGIMDKDFLTPKEIESIRQKVPNLFVLNYYSIESYLYHPENLAEIIEGFDIEKYKNELKLQKQSLYETIIYGLKNARDSYKVLTREKIKTTNSKDDILTSLKSDVFEDFYPYLDMKNKFKHGDFNVPKTDLMHTKWIKQAISEIFNTD